MEHRITKYFDLRELVSKPVWQKYGNRAWAFFDTRLLDIILWVREGYGMPLVCNNWMNGGSYSQRGFRENTCQIVADKTSAGSIYCSAHNLGKGVDLSSNVVSAYEIRKWIRANRSSAPHPFRIESDKSAPTWVHIDVMTMLDEGYEEFNA